MLNKSVFTRILIADDHPVVRRGLAAIIEYEPDMTVVGQASNGHEAIEVFRSCQPDIVLMDLRMPKLSGVEAIKTICTDFQNASIIIVTTFDGDEDIYCGIEAGAKGYLLKDAEPDEFIEAIRNVACGQKYISPTVAAKLKERTDKPKLSDRELEVLSLITNGKSNREISASLFITEGTVKYHVNNILGKLRVNDRTQAALFALKRGMVNFEHLSS
jgi:two-component system, NarL family, response regulator